MTVKAQVSELSGIALDWAVLWTSSFNEGEHQMTGPTLLIAAMRCYVAKKLGLEVDVPDDLAEESSEKPKGEFKP